MRKALLAAIVTFAVAIFAEVFLRESFHMPGIGIMFAISVMGGFIIYFNEGKKS